MRGQHENFIVALIVSRSRIGCVASPAEAAKKKHGTSGAPPTPWAGGTSATYQGGVMRGPLYNGQDYLGDDPDPNIRAYLLRDLSGDTAAAVKMLTSRARVCVRPTTGETK
jgi:hypothetical protein